MYIGPVNAAKLLNDFSHPNYDRTIMVAIAGAESSWNTTAVSATNDYGLWQINNQAWPGLFRDYNWWDPLDNAKMMNHVLLRQGITAWTTYTSGAYKRYWYQAQNAVQQAGGGGYSGGSPAPPGAGGYSGAPTLQGAMDVVTRTVQRMADDEIWWTMDFNRLW